jgi:FixJ family two-component response regulator
MTTPGGKPTAKIGLVDDDRSIRKAIGRLLRSHGFMCKTYESADEALADPELREMDCLVLDIHLEGSSGFELRNRLREMRINIPHIFITALTEPDSREWVQQVEGTPCLGKPFEEWQLVTLLRALLEANSL